MLALADGRRVASVRAGGDASLRLWRAGGEVCKNNESKQGNNKMQIFYDCTKVQTIGGAAGVQQVPGDECLQQHLHRCAVVSLSQTEAMHIHLPVAVQQLFLHQTRQAQHRES